MVGNDHRATCCFYFFLPNPHALALILRHYVQSSLHLFDRSSMAKQNLSHRANVICDGSPSRIRRVRRISLGITTRPRSSMRRTMPVAFIYAPPMPFVLYWFQSYCLHTQEKYAGKAAPHNSAGASASIVNCQFHRFTFLRKCSTLPLFLCCSAYFSAQKPCEILWIVVGFPVFYTEFPFQHARSVLY